MFKRSKSVRRGGPGQDALAHGPRESPMPLVDDLGLVSGSTLYTPASRPRHENAVSPIRFPDGMNPYVHRPLPPRPEKIQSNNVFLAMPARPSTSGGPNAKASAFLGLTTETSLINKRLSKDDSFLPAQRGQKKGFSSFRFGARSGLPTPEASPDMSYHFMPPPPIRSRTGTPESMSSSSYGDIQIGMALGSPKRITDASSGWHSPQGIHSDPRHAHGMDERAKAPRRRFLGGLFGGRKNSEASRDGEMNETTSSMDTAALLSGPQQKTESTTPTRSKTVTDRKAVKHKPIIIRSNTISSPIRREFNEAKGVPVQPLGNNTFTIPPPPPIPASPKNFLDVEIPSIKMDRYSVMFSSVLAPQSTSSLLARRQATLDKLKTIKTQIAEVEEEKEKDKVRQRPATSPQPTKSPAFSLFPAPPTRQGTLPPPPRQLSARDRSFTSPAILPSPSRQTFAPAQPEIRVPGTVASAYRSSSRDRSAPERRAPLVVPKEAGFHFGQDESGLLDSEDDEEVPVTSARGPLKPKLSEPAWQMMASPPASSASSTLTRRSPSSSASSVHTHITRPSVDVAPDVAHLDEAESALRAAVEISIARQISLSQQQRSLLMRPLQTNVSSIPRPVQPVPGGAVRKIKLERSSPTTGAAVKPLGANPVTVPRSAIRKGSLSANERVVETKSAMPTLVVPRQARDGIAAGNRKSERVVLEAL